MCGVAHHRLVNEPQSGQWILHSVQHGISSSIPGHVNVHGHRVRHNMRMNQSGCSGILTSRSPHTAHTHPQTARRRQPWSSGSRGSNLLTLSPGISWEIRQNLGIKSTAAAFSRSELIHKLNMRWKSRGFYSPFNCRYFPVKWLFPATPMTETA